MRAIILSGLLTYDDFEAVMCGIEDIDICGAMVHETKSMPSWDPSRTGLRTWTRKDLGRPDVHLDRTPYHEHYERALKLLLSDARSYYMVERVYGTGGSRSVFNHTLRLDKVIWNSLNILFETKPDRIVSTNTPHDVSWFFTRIAEMLGIQLYMTATSPLPWRTWVVKGLDEQTLLPAADWKTVQEALPNDAILEFVANGRSSYDIAMPGYERRKMERYNGRFFDALTEIKAILTTKSPRFLPIRIHSAFKKKMILDAYNKYAATYVAPEKYIVLFLHVQPERTTLPEGGIFAQQWLAIRLITESIPADWRLVVKEHPSTFRNMLRPSVRDAHFYEAINALPNALLAPMEMTPFQLIDGARAVATVTGVVGVEAIIRRKPVLVFGIAQYRKMQGVFAVGTIAQVRSAIAQIDAGCDLLSDDELLDYFSWVEQNSFAKDDRLNGSIGALRMALQC